MSEQVISRLQQAAGWDGDREAITDAVLLIKSLQEQVAALEYHKKIAKGSVKQLNQTNLDQSYEIKHFQEQVAAPEDNGIEELDALCAMYNRKEIDITGLVCRIWNNQQAKVAELESENIGLRILVDDWVLEVFDREET